MSYEDWQTKYEQELAEYKAAKESTSLMQEQLTEHQHRYIKREQEYKQVIGEIETKIKDNSTRPLDIVEEKTEDQYLLEGIDIHDKEQSKEIKRMKQL